MKWGKINSTESIVAWLILYLFRLNVLHSIIPNIVFIPGIPLKRNESHHIFVHPKKKSSNCSLLPLCLSNEALSNEISP